jgi:hypothetical protein
LFVHLIKIVITLMKINSVKSGDLIPNLKFWKRELRNKRGERKLYIDKKIYIYKYYLCRDLNLCN